MKIYKNAYLLDWSGRFKKGELAVDSGRIAARPRKAGKAEVIDLNGAYVTPGFIDSHTHIGICQDGVGSIGSQHNEATDPVTPHMRATDAVYPGDMALKDALAGGVTAGMITPGSSNIICGTTAVCKFHGDLVEDMVVVDPAGMKMALGENPFRCFGSRAKFPSTRMGNAALLRETLFKACTYRDKKKKAKKAKAKEFDPDFMMEALLPVVEGKIPARLHAHRADDIATAVRIAREFRIRLVIEHATESHKMAGFLHRHRISCVIGPNISAREKLELRDRTFKTPAVLHENGVKFAFMTDHPVIPVNLLVLSASLAVKAGLPRPAAYAALTINGAEICGADGRIGSLERGKDADFVVWDREPLEFGARVVATYVNGNRVYGEMA